MVLTGGGALLRNLDRSLWKKPAFQSLLLKTRLRRGGGKALEMIDMHGGDLFSEKEFHAGRGSVCLPCLV